MHHVDDPVYMTAEERATGVAAKGFLAIRMNVPKKS